MVVCEVSEIMPSILKRVKHSESGQALVEFALTLPLFLAMVFFVIDFGWISYQEFAFEQGYMSAGWRITAGSVGDVFPADENPSPATFSGAAVADPLKVYIVNSAWGLIGSNLTVTNAQADFSNTTEHFTVPGRTGIPVQASSYTRSMRTVATIQYTINPLTFMGQLIFGSSVLIEKDFECDRIVATAQRSE